MKRNEFAASKGLSAFQKEVAPDTSLRRVVEARVRAADKGAVFKVMVDGELLGPFQEIRCACACALLFSLSCHFLCCAAFVLPLSRLAASACGRAWASCGVVSHSSFAAALRFALQNIGHPAAWRSAEGGGGHPADGAPCADLLPAAMS